MSKQAEIAKNTCLALATGLFTGGVVARIISPDNPGGILYSAYVPALVFYAAYLILCVCDTKENARKNPGLMLLFFFIFVVFVLFQSLK